MNVTRRRFMQVSGATAAGLAVSRLGFDLSPVKAHARTLKTRDAKESTTICCYCAVGCGAIVHTAKKDGGRVINIEGEKSFLGLGPDRNCQAGESHPGCHIYGEK